MPALRHRVTRTHLEELGVPGAEAERVAVDPESAESGLLEQHRG